RRLPPGRPRRRGPAGRPRFGPAAARAQPAQSAQEADGGAAARLRAAGGAHGGDRQARAGRARRRDREGAGPMSGATRIPVGGESPYEVVVGTGVYAELPGLLRPGVSTVAVIHPEGLPELARPVTGALSEAGYDVVALPVPDGEACKTAEVAA